MQTTASRKQKRFDHQQVRWLALIIGLVATVAVVAVVLTLARTGDETEQASVVIVATQPPFSETLNKGMLSPSAGQQERNEVVRREGLQTAAQGVVVPVAEDPPLPEGWVDPYFTRHEVDHATFPPTIAE